MSGPGLPGVTVMPESIAESAPVVSPPLVSISIITYNQAQWIRGSVESALAQDYPRLEVVVADDASSDGTSEIVQSLAMEHPGVVKPVLSQVNEGITRNSNKALAQCTGKYVALCAGDDLLLPGKIRKQVAWLEKSDRRVLVGHYVDVRNVTLEASEGVYKTGLAGEQGAGCREVVRNGAGSTFLGSSVMVRRAAVPRCGFDDRMEVASDWKFIIDVIGESAEWGTVPEVLSVYRRHGANTTLMRRRKIMDDTIRTLRLVEAERPWLREDAAPMRRLYEYAWNKELFLEADRGADKRTIARAILRPPPGAPRWKALALLVAMCVGGSGLRRVMNAREARKHIGPPTHPLGANA
jgi:glycosyltransferase involved in cell wall biosynthesis